MIAQCHTLWLSPPFWLYSGSGDRICVGFEKICGLFPRDSHLPDLPMKVITLAIFVLAMGASDRRHQDLGRRGHFEHRLGRRHQLVHQRRPAGGRQSGVPRHCQRDGQGHEQQLRRPYGFCRAGFQRPSDYSVMGIEFDLVSGGIVLNYTSGTTTIGNLSSVSPPARGRVSTPALTSRSSDHRCSQSQRRAVLVATFLHANIPSAATS